MAIQTDLLTDSTGLKSVNVGDVVDGHCTAWVNFDGAAGVIRASFNVASVVRTAVGQYTITFTTSMANANYVATGYAGHNTINTGAVNNLKFFDVTPSTFTAQSTYTGGLTGVAYDRPLNYVAIFGGK